MSFQVPYTAGIIICYMVCLAFSLALIRYNFKLDRRKYVAFVWFAFFYITLIHRNYKVFILSNMHFSNDVMFSNYLGAAFALVAMIFLWMYRIRA